MDLNFNHPVKALIVDVDCVVPLVDKIKLTTSGVEISKLTEDQMSMKPYWHNSNVQIQALGDCNNLPRHPIRHRFGNQSTFGFLELFKTRKRPTLL